MDAENRSRMDEYMEMLNELKEKVEQEETAARLVAEIAKDRRMREMRQEKEENGEKPATRKQINYLRALGADVHEGRLTKARASELIEQQVQEKALDRQS